MKAHTGHRRGWLLAATMLTGIGLGFGQSTMIPAAAAGEPKAEATGSPKRLDSYTLRGIIFSYYLVPAGLSEEELVTEAGRIHAREPDAQLILVDDESGVPAYVEYAKAVSTGRTDVELPQAWADAHVIANLQKLMGGKWMLYKSYGYEELGEVR